MSKKRNAVSKVVLSFIIISCVLFTNSFMLPTYAKGPFLFKINEKKKKKENTYYVGDTVESDGMKIVYLASGEYREDNQFLQPKEGYKYIFLKLAFVNDSKSKKGVSFYDFEAYADGYSTEMYYGGDENLSATLPSGRSEIGQIYFEIPVDAKEIEIEYTSNLFSNEKLKFIYEGDKDSGIQLEQNTKATKGAYKVGDTIKGKEMNITYVSCGEYVSDNMFIQPKENNHYISVELEFENTGDSDQHISSFDFHCYANGVSCNQVFSREDDLGATLSPGRKTKGTVTFEVPYDAEVIEVEYHENLFSSNSVVFSVEM